MDELQQKISHKLEKAEKKRGYNARAYNKKRGLPTGFATNNPQKRKKKLKRKRDEVRGKTVTEAQRENTKNQNEQRRVDASRRKAAKKAEETGMFEGVLKLQKITLKKEEVKNAKDYAKVPVHRMENGILTKIEDQLDFWLLRYFADKPPWSAYVRHAKERNELVANVIQVVPVVTPDPLFVSTPSCIVDFHDPSDIRFDVTLTDEQCCGTTYPFDLPRDPEDWQTPAMDKMMADQSWTMSTAIWYWTNLGSLLYPTGSIDHWEFLPFLLGAPRTGKTTMSEFIARCFFNSEQVAAVGNSEGDTFQLGSLSNDIYRLLMFTEVSGKKGGVSRGFLCSVATGETVSIRALFKNPKAKKLTIRPFGSGNFIFGNIADSDYDLESIKGRLVIFPFYNLPPFFDTKLNRKLDSEAGAAIMKAVDCYARAIMYTDSNPKIKVRDMLSAQILAGCMNLGNAENSWVDFMVDNIREVSPGEPGYDKADDIWMKDAQTRFKVWAGANQRPMQGADKRNKAIYEALVSMNWEKQNGCKGGKRNGTVKIRVKCDMDAHGQRSNQDRLVWKYTLPGDWAPALDRSKDAGADSKECQDFVNFFMHQKEADF